MRKMNEELMEIKPVAEHERIRRQINPSNGNGDFFSDGCSKSEYEASIKIKLQNLLLENEKNKTEYIENQLSLRKGKLAKKMKLTFYPAIDTDSITTNEWCFFFESKASKLIN